MLFKTVQTTGLLAACGLYKTWAGPLIILLEGDFAERPSLISTLGSGTLTGSSCVVCYSKIIH